MRLNRRNLIIASGAVAASPLLSRAGALAQDASSGSLPRRRSINDVRTSTRKRGVSPGVHASASIK